MEAPAQKPIEEAPKDNDEILDFVASEVPEANKAKVTEAPKEEVKEVFINEQPEEEKKEEIAVETISETPKLVVEEAPEEVAPVLDEVVAAPKPEVSAPVADKYQNASGIFGERSEAISDVRKAISITDRFLYLKELFANNMDAFNDALDEVNKAESMHEAATYLSQFNWEDNETSQQFMRLVSRRFI